MSLQPKEIYYSNTPYMDLSVAPAYSVIEVAAVRSAEDDNDRLGIFTRNAETGEEELLLDVRRSDYDAKMANVDRNLKIFLLCNADNEWELRNDVSSLLSCESHNLSFFATATAVLARRFKHDILRVRTLNRDAELAPEADVEFKETFLMVTYIPRNPAGEVAKAGGDATWLEAFAFRSDAEWWTDRIESEEMPTDGELLDEVSPLNTTEEFYTSAVMVDLDPKDSRIITYSDALMDPYFVLAMAPEFCPTWIPLPENNVYLKMDRPDLVPPSERERMGNLYAEAKEQGMLGPDEAFRPDAGMDTIASEISDQPGEDDNEPLH